MTPLLKTEIVPFAVPVGITKTDHAPTRNVISFCFFARFLFHNQAVNNGKNFILLMANRTCFILKGTIILTTFLKDNNMKGYVRFR